MGMGLQAPAGNIDDTGSWLVRTVPEPSTGMLMALGLARLSVWRPRLVSRA